MKYIAVTGTDSEDTNFLFSAVKKIIELSENDNDFTVIKESSNADPKGIDPDLIFTQMNKPKGDETVSIYFGLLNWVKHPKHAYCMVSEEHPLGLHNYNNFKNMIVPLNLVFKPFRFEVDKSGKNINPATLIDALRPKVNEQES